MKFTSTEIWKGAPQHYKWGILKAVIWSNGNLRIDLLRQLTGERIPESDGITLPAECLGSLLRFLEENLNKEG